MRAIALLPAQAQLLKMHATALLHAEAQLLKMCVTALLPAQAQLPKMCAIALPHAPQQKALPGTLISNVTHARLPPVCAMMFCVACVTEHTGH